MKISENLRVVVTLLACIGMLSPVAAFGAPPTAVPTQKTVSVQDTKLVDNALVGKVVDAQGNAVANTAVNINRSGQEAIQVTTGPQGEFSVAGLTGGVYRVSTNGTVANFRVWTAAAAPPVATDGVLLVDYNSIVTRGQCGAGGCANSAPAYGAPVGIGAPAYGGAVGGGEVIYGGGGGCNGGGAGDGGVVYGDASGGGYVDGGYANGGGYVDGGYIDGGYAGGGVPCDAGGTYVAAPAYGGGGGGGGFLGFLSSPWIIGAGVAAAIAIPLALDDDDDDNAAGNGNGNGSGNGGGGAAS